MKIVLKLTLFGIAVLMACAPNNPDDEEIENSDMLKSSMALEGQWISACQQNLDPYLEGDVVRRVLEIKGNSYTLTTTSHTATNKVEGKNPCDGLEAIKTPALMTQRKTGELNLQALSENEAPDSTRKLNLYQGNTMLTLHDRDIVDSYNDHETCGIQNWELNRPKSIAGKKCWGVVVAPVAPIFTIARLKQSPDDKVILCLGMLDSNMTGKSEILRPTVEDPACFDKLEDANRKVQDSEKSVVVTE